MHRFVSSVYFSVFGFLVLGLISCKKSDTQNGMNADNLQGMNASGILGSATTCVSANDVTKELAAGVSNLGTLQLKQLFAPQVFVDNVGLLSVYVEYDTLGADASGSTPAGVDMTPTFMIWKACDIKNSSSCTNNGKWNLNYNFSADNITDMPKTVNKVSVKVCVPSPKFLTPADQAKAVNSCDANFPCFCGAETNMTYDNSKGVLPSSTVQAQIDAVKQAHDKMYAIAQTYVNAATNYVSQCSTQDASSNQSAAKIGLQYAQNISALSPSDIAFDAEQIASQRLAYLQALSSANQGMQLASTTDPNAMCTANTSGTNSETKTGLGLVDSREEANKKFFIGIGLDGLGLLLALGGGALLFADGRGLGGKGNDLTKVSRSDLKRMLLHENDRMLRYYDKFEKASSYKEKLKFYNKIREKAKSVGAILEQMNEKRIFRDGELANIKQTKHWELVEKFNLPEIAMEFPKSSELKSSQFLIDEMDSIVAKAVNDVHPGSYTFDNDGKPVLNEAMKEKIRGNYTEFRATYKKAGILSNKLGTKGMLGMGVMIGGVISALAGVGVTASTLGLNASCGAFLTTASTYEGQLLSQQSAIQNAETNLNP